MPATSSCEASPALATPVVQSDIASLLLAIGLVGAFRRSELMAAGLAHSFMRLAGSTLPQRGLFIEFCLKA